MGTRNLICVVSNSEYKVANYGQWDGDPGCLGRRILEFLTKVDIIDFKGRVNKLSFYNDEEIGNINEGDTTDKDKYHHLDRDRGVDVLYAIAYDKYSYKTNDKLFDYETRTREVKVEKLVNSLNFAADSLFCEWCYLIDLDKNTFEIYKGFNKSKLEAGERFEFLMGLSEDGYYPVRFVKSYNLSELPPEEQFLEEMVGKND